MREYIWNHTKYQKQGCCIKESTAKINAFSPITGTVTDIGGVHGTSFCDDLSITDICSVSNTKYGKYLPSSNECFFVYYKKIIK
jgi:hypothetical protein